MESICFVGQKRKKRGQNMLLESAESAQTGQETIFSERTLTEEIQAEQAITGQRGKQTMKVLILITIGNQ
jgi:hypothetical protein